MNKQLLAVAFAFVASAFSVPAFADSFTGVCTLSGTATLAPPITAVPGSGGFSFQTNNKLLGGAANLCTGMLNNVQVTNAVASATASGMGTLGCSVSLAMNGTGTLTIAGTPIDFKNLTIVGTGPQVTLALNGNVSGNATGQASFATDTTAAGKCAAAAGAGTLDFVIAATAASLTD